MTTIIITRHPGALKWIYRHTGFKDVKHIQHASEADIRGNRVIGTLPVHLAAMAGEYWHLTMDIPPHLRGKELSCEQMEQLGCKIVCYKLTKL